MLLPTLAGYRDVVELKRPDHKALMWDQGHKNYYLSADSSRAIGQVHNYMDRLHMLAQQGLDEHPEIIAYHPRAIIVIGRSHNWRAEQTRALRGMNQRLHGITVMTYDHLLAQARQLSDELNQRRAPVSANAHTLRQCVLRQHAE
jgi:hypothetical protein